MLDHSTEQERLLENIVLVSEEEYQKALSNTKVQPLVHTTNDTPIKVDTQVQTSQIKQHKEDVQSTPKKEEQ